MVAYAFRGELLCDKCAAEWRQTRLERHAERLDVDPESTAAREALIAEDTGDSNDYPQGPYFNGGGEADSPQHCGSCGTFLENPLTTDGMAYVRAEIRKKGAAVLGIWAPFYGLTDEDCQEGMTHVWLAETFTGELVNCTSVHATAEGARKAVESILSNANPGYRETGMSGPYDEGETKFIARATFETVGTVRKCRVQD